MNRLDRVFPPTERAPSRTNYTHQHAIAGLLGLALAMGVGRFAFTPLLPLMKADAGVSIANGAWLAAANYCGYLLGAVAALSVDGNTSTLIRAALVATTAATLGMGMIESLPAWLCLRWVAGFASAFLLVFISAWSLERVASAGQPFLAATVFSGVGAGIFVVGLLCLGLDYLGAGSAGAWIALGVLSLLLSIAVWHRFSGDDIKVPDAAHAAAERSASFVSAWRLIACYGLFGFGYIIPATFLPVMGRGVVGNAWAFQWSWPVFGMAACLSTFVVAHVSARGSGLHAWRIAQVTMALGVALPAFRPASMLLVAAALSIGGTFMVVTMMGMQTAKRFAGGAARRLMAAMTAAFATGQLAGPLTVPYVVTPDGDFSTILLLSAGSLLAGVCLLPLRADAGQRLPADSVTRKAT